MFILRLEMFPTKSPKTYAGREALYVWRAAADLVSVRWQTFLGADADARRFAFASYVAALDAEEAAAADMAAIAVRDRALVDLRLSFPR